MLSVHFTILYAGFRHKSYIYQWGGGKGGECCRVTVWSLNPCPLRVIWIWISRVTHTIQLPSQQQSQPTHDDRHHVFCSQFFLPTPITNHKISQAISLSAEGWSVYRLPPNSTSIHQRCGHPPLRESLSKHSYRAGLIRRAVTTLAIRPLVSSRQVEWECEQTH